MQGKKGLKYYHTKKPSYWTENISPKVQIFIYIHSLIHLKFNLQHYEYIFTYTFQVQLSTL
jgi:hypothetical protein